MCSSSVGSFLLVAAFRGVNEDAIFDIWSIAFMPSDCADSSFEPSSSSRLGQRPGAHGGPWEPPPCIMPPCHERNQSDPPRTDAIRAALAGMRDTSHGGTAGSP